MFLGLNTIYKISKNYERFLGSKWIG